MIHIYVANYLGYLVNPCCACTWNYNLSTISQLTKGLHPKVPRPCTLLCATHPKLVGGVSRVQRGIKWRVKHLAPQPHHKTLQFVMTASSGTRGGSQSFQPVAKGLNETLQVPTKTNNHLYVDGDVDDDVRYVRYYILFSQPMIGLTTRPRTFLSRNMALWSWPLNAGRAPFFQDSYTITVPPIIARWWSCFGFM